MTQDKQDLRPLLEEIMARALAQEGQTMTCIVPDGTTITSDPQVAEILAKDLNNE